MNRNYSKELPRVSHIVSFAFPFEGYARERYESWLKEKGITPEEYMEEAVKAGTYVHKALEKYIQTGEFRGRKYNELVEAGIRWMQENNITRAKSEVYIRTSRYQGTTDLVCTINGEKWLIDWKTFGIAKKKWNIASVYRKPYDKLKKAELQLSMYAHPLGIANIGVVELCENGDFHFHVLNIWDKKDVKKVVDDYHYSLLTE